MNNSEEYLAWLENGSLESPPSSVYAEDGDFSYRLYHRADWKTVAQRNRRFKTLAALVSRTAEYPQYSVHEPERQAIFVEHLYRLASGAKNSFTLRNYCKVRTKASSVHQRLRLDAVFEGMRCFAAHENLFFDHPELTRDFTPDECALALIKCYRTRI